MKAAPHVLWVSEVYGKLHGIMSRCGSQTISRPLAAESPGALLALPEWLQHTCTSSIVVVGFGLPFSAFLSLRRCMFNARNAVSEE